MLICVAYINRYYIVDGYFYLLFLKNFFDNGIKKETDESIQWDGVTEWDQNVQWSDQWEEEKEEWRFHNGYKNCANECFHRNNHRFCHHV